MTPGYRCRPARRSRDVLSGPMRRLVPSILLALPALSLAVAGLLHPHHLTYDTSYRWFALHLPGLLVFPLVGVALAVLVRTRADPLAWGIRLDGLRLCDLLHRARRDQRRRGRLRHPPARARGAATRGGQPALPDRHPARGDRVLGAARVLCPGSARPGAAVRRARARRTGAAARRMAGAHRPHLLAQRCARDAAARPGNGIAGLCGRDTTGKFEDQRQPPRAPARHSG